MSRKLKRKLKVGKISATNPATAGSDDRWRVLGICILLTAIVWVVFGQTLGYGFVNYDDPDYVTDNPEVCRGITLQGIAWAFNHIYAANWFPLTWVSHMLDCQFYRLNPGGHHLTNVLIHTVTVIVLFLVLWRTTGFLWRGAFVAAVFAIHPLRVESVAWVAERKDVLSGLFCMLTIGAYVRYARQPYSAVRYGTVVLLFALGLMCKPMLVTLPFVLLLLDYWPLHRFQSAASTQSVFRLGGWRWPQRLILEKLPLIGLAAASCVVTIFAQTKAIQSLERISLPARAGNVMVSYAVYLGQMVWPSRLAVLYPFPINGQPLWKIILALFFLLSITASAIFLRKIRPYLLVGWFWYLIMLLPVIGILQVGMQAHADRYTYLPQIGVYVLLTWGMADLIAGWRGRRVLLGGSAAVSLVGLMICARSQVSFWQNSELLWTHTINCTADNSAAQDSLGNDLLRRGNLDAAISHFQKAFQIKPDFAEAHNNLGTALIIKGNVDEAIAQYKMAFQIKPDYAEAFNNLGSALLQKGSVDAAIVQYQMALERKPDFAEAHNNLGNALLQKGGVDAAIDHYQVALRLNPDYAKAHFNLGNALLQKGNTAAAIDHYQTALQLNPDYAKARNNLAVVLLKTGKTGEAITQFQMAMDSARATGQTEFMEQIRQQLEALQGGVSVPSATK